MTLKTKKCDINNKDEVQEITAAGNPIKKSKAVYVTCNQTFAMSWKKHI